MDRRQFFSVTGAAAAAGALPVAEAAPKKTQGRLPSLKARLGHQFGALTDQTAAWVARFGLDAICTRPVVADPQRLYPTVDELKVMLDIADRHKVKVEIVDSVLLQSSDIDKEKHAGVVLGLRPERDREIEAFQNYLRNCAAAGIRCIKYNMVSLTGVPRLEEVPGRGDTVYNRWNYKEAVAKNPPLTRAGIVNDEAFWERTNYFLERIAPVAAETRVRIACHPEDPGMPPQGYRGIATPLGTFEGMKKFIALHENPYHGLNFCQGTMSENLNHPNDEIGDVIRYFGSRKKIFNVHFRNIRGHRDDFVAEMFPDEGDVDFVKALKVYREVGYEDLLMPDHAPKVLGAGAQSGQRENFAFEFGYIRGLIQAEQHVV